MGSTNRFFDIDAKLIIKNRVLDRVLKKYEFTMDFRCHIDRVEMARVMFLHYACCNLKDLGGYKN